MDKRIIKASAAGYIEALEGIRRKTLAYGEKTLMVEFKLEKGKAVPLHSHPEEQIGYLVSGHVLFTIDGEEYDIHQGDSWAIKGGVQHGMEIIDESVAIEVFSPVRTDYL